MIDLILLTDRDLRQRLQGRFYKVSQVWNAYFENH
jgi:hypothetical protein